MREDLRYAVRVLVQGKAWSAMVVLSLALGIGANTGWLLPASGLASGGPAGGIDGHRRRS